MTRGILIIIISPQYEPQDWRLTDDNIFWPRLGHQQALTEENGTSLLIPSGCTKTFTWSWEDMVVAVCFAISGIRVFPDALYAGSHVFYYSYIFIGAF